MFNKIQEEYLLRHFSRNNVLLFLGAGFSKDAKNLKNESLPIGKEFSEKIWEYLGKSDPFDSNGASLQDMYQILINSRISHSNISTFLNENLLVKEYPEYYKYLTTPYWYKIYTINVDDLIDKIYNKYSSQKIVKLKYPIDEYRERDQLLDSIQSIYLHGKLPCKPNDIIFSRKQYANASIKLQPLYFHFIQDYSTLPTIFIGTSLDEQLLDYYIAARQSRSTGTAENRPKSFLITPHISQVKEQILKDEYNIETIKATTEDFLNWIRDNQSKFPKKDDILVDIIPSLKDIIITDQYRHYIKRSVTEFSETFRKIEIHVNQKSNRKSFLLGSTPTWNDIYTNLDAPRKITTKILEEVQIKYLEDKANCIAILGSAGSGKSTVLKRTCFELVKEGRKVFYCYSENLPPFESIVDVLSMYKEKVIFAIDNAELILRQLIKIIDKLNNLDFPPLIILASRTNLFDRINTKNDPIKNLTEYEMPNLDQEEIIEIIKKLDENNLLGYLKGLNDKQRIKEFENRAKKQILVAMREATHGRDFDEIMKSEYSDLGDTENKILCICVALATEAGFTLSKQDFVSFSAKTPGDALDILERNLKSIVLKVGVNDSKLLLRHRVIAEFLIDRCADTQVLKQSYIRVLTSLASEINASTYNSRKFFMYKEIINHSLIYRRFSKDIDNARELFESLVDYFRNDYHFWLQYGSLELEGTGGNLDLSENYLKQAESLRTNPYTKGALAHLFYKKSHYTKNKEVAFDLRTKADEILLELLRNKFTNDPYIYHILGVGRYYWIQDWVVGRDNVKEELLKLKKIIDEGADIYSNDKKLKELKDIIQKAILMTAVNSDKINFPVLYTDSR